MIFNEQWNCWRLHHDKNRYKMDFIKRLSVICHDTVFRAFCTHCCTPGMIFVQVFMWTIMLHYLPYTDESKDIQKTEHKKQTRERQETERIWFWILNGLQIEGGWFLLSEPGDAVRSSWSPVEICCFNASNIWERGGELRDPRKGHVFDAVRGSMDVGVVVWVGTATVIVAFIFATTLSTPHGSK